MKKSIFSLMLGLFLSVMFFAGGVEAVNVYDSRDGQSYPTFKAGDQVWMAKNLNYSFGNSWCYDNKSENCDNYGRLYDWNSAQDACPSDWRLPSVEDYKILEKSIGNNLAIWMSPGNWNGLYAGSHSAGRFYDLGKAASWWTTNSTSTYAFHQYAYITNNVVYELTGAHSLGFSVRCIQEHETPQIKVSVISPKGGDSYYPGQQVEIVWQEEGFPRDINVQIQLNKGAKYQGGLLNPVGEATDYFKSTGRYVFTIPQDIVPGDDYSFLINTDYPQTEIGYSGYSENFSVVSESEEPPIINPKVNITSPTKGENIVIGKPYTITWEADGFEGRRVYIYVGRSLITTVPSDVGSYNYTFKSNKENIIWVGVLNQQGTKWESIEKVEVNFVEEDQSDIPSPIINPKVNITSPTKGENIVIGKPYTITWEADGFEGRRVYIYVGRSLITTVPSDVGSYNYTFKSNKENIIWVGVLNQQGTKWESIEKVEVNFVEEDRVAPRIERIDPAQGSGGDRITIYGTNLFGFVPSGIIIEWLKDGVVIGTTTSPIEESLDGRSLKFNFSNILAGNMDPGKYQIRVFNDGGASNALDFVYKKRVAPRIERIDPAQGSGGDRITIYGTNLFGFVPSGIIIEWLKDGVVIGTTTSPIEESLDGRSLKFNFSNILAGNMDPGKYQIRVFNDGGASNALDFVYKIRSTNLPSINIPKPVEGR